MKLLAALVYPSLDKLHLQLQEKLDDHQSQQVSFSQDHLIVVEAFQSGPKWWTKQKTNIDSPGVT